MNIVTFINDEFTRYKVQYKIYSVQTNFHLYSVQFTVYTVHYTLYSIHSTMYSVHCILYTVHWSIPLILNALQCTYFPPVQSEARCSSWITSKIFLVGTFRSFSIGHPVRSFPIGHPVRSVPIGYLLESGAFGHPAISLPIALVTLYEFISYDTHKTYSKYGHTIKSFYMLSLMKQIHKLCWIRYLYWSPSKNIFYCLSYQKRFQ